MEAHRAHFAELHTKLDSSVKEGHRKFNDVASQLQSKSAEMRSDIEAKLATHRQHLVTFYHSPHSTTSPGSRCA